MHRGGGVSALTCILETRFWKPVKVGIFFIDVKSASPHIIIAVVYIFISLYVYIFPVPRIIVATALNIWEKDDIFLF